MSSGGGGNPIKKISEGAKDLYGSIKDDPMGALTSAEILGTSRARDPIKKINEGAKDLYGSIKDDPMGALTSAATLGIRRAREDMRDQAAGMAEKEQIRAAEAEARAVDASVKDLDPISLERRRRAALAANKGRAGTILTAGTSLGSADVGRKVLLGL